MKKLLFLLMVTFIPIFLTGMKDHPSVDTTESVKSEPKLIEVSPWRKSSNKLPAYGQGLFWFSTYRTARPDKMGQYTYYVYFISQSYHTIKSGKDNTKPAPTYLGSVSIYVNGVLVTNQLTGTKHFSLRFLGDIKTGKGDLGIVFKGPLPMRFYLEWHLPPIPD